MHSEGDTMTRKAFTKRSAHEAIAIVASDLVYAIGVLFFAWQVFDILVILWIESVLVGLAGLFRLFLAGGTTFSRRLQISVFYTVAGTLFSLVFGLFAFVFYSGLNVPGDREASLAAMVIVVTDRSVVISGLLIAASLVYDFVVGYIGSGAFRYAQGEWEMTHVGLRQPLLVICLMFGGVILQEHGTPVPGLIFVVLIKMGVELLFAFHRTFASHRSMTAKTSEPI
jgi:hypothetical protein